VVVGDVAVVVLLLLAELVDEAGEDVVGLKCQQTT
jgi:hypothetical protein